MQRRLIIKIQSISDIITNSSSEVFVINNSSEPLHNTVKDIIKTGNKFYHDGDECCSGMGGEFGVYTWENGFRMYKHRHKHSRNNPDYTPQMWADEIGIPLEKLMSVIVVDIDWSRKSTIDYIVKNYGAQEVDTIETDEDFFYDFIDAYEPYYEKELMFREDFDSDDEYESYLLEFM